MSKIFSLLLVVVAGLLLSCEQEIYVSSSATEDFPMFLDGDVRIPVTGANFEVSYRTNPEGNFFDNLGAIGTLSAGELGNTLVLGLFTTAADLTSFSGYDPVATLQFWPEDLAANRDAEVGELATYFADNTVFPFGEGPGKVDFSLALEPPGARTGLSSSAYVSMPEGSLQIERVFEYVGSIPGVPEEEQTFQLILFSYAGQVGVFSFPEFQQALEDGVPYLAKDVAEIQGEGALVLEGTWR